MPRDGDLMQGKIYKIVNSVDDYVYIGCTTSSTLNRCFTCIRGNPCLIHRQLMDRIKEYGMNKFSIVLIKDYPCETRKKLEAELERTKLAFKA
jgi:hypothetical protein